jgi:hypothetical protein
MEMLFVNSGRQYGTSSAIIQEHFAAKKGRVNSEVTASNQFKSWFRWQRV